MDSSAGHDNVSRLLARLPRPVWGVLRLAGRLARDEGSRAYLVGGLVRDLLLGEPAAGRRSAKRGAGAKTAGLRGCDLDVVVEGDARRVARGLAGAPGARLRLHPAFQTATVFLEAGLRMDLTTARTERYRRPAALPEVSPGDLRQDLSRRDFTINALAVRLTPPGFGRLVDYFGGRQDLCARRIRVLHRLSFIDDPTRAFRAARFAARLGFTLAPATRRLVGVALREDVFSLLSADRLRREIEHVLGEARAVPAVRLLSGLGLLSVLHPRLEATRRTYIWLRKVEDVLHARQENVHRWVVRLALLLEELGPAARAQVLHRLRPGGVTRAILEEAPRRVRRIGRKLARPRSPAPSAIHAACRDEPLEILLLAIVLSPGGNVRRSVVRYLDELRGARPDIRGNDMIRAGVPEGPAIAAGLNSALRAKLDGRAPTAREQLAVALRAARSQA